MWQWQVYCHWAPRVETIKARLVAGSLNNIKATALKQHIIKCYQQIVLTDVRVSHHTYRQIDR